MQPFFQRPLFNDRKLAKLVPLEATGESSRELNNLAERDRTLILKL